MDGDVTINFFVWNTYSSSGLNEKSVVKKCFWDEFDVEGRSSS